jgi:hypothetical protein
MDLFLFKSHFGQIISKITILQRVLLFLSGEFDCHSGRIILRRVLILAGGQKMRAYFPTGQF